MNDARAIPPKTTTDIANRLSAPAPELIISGIAPNKVDIVVPGLMTCSKEYSIMDLLWTIRWQKQNIDKTKKKLLCSISVPKNNFFSNKQAKYFGFKKLSKNDKYFAVLKKLFNFKKGINYYSRLINEKI